MLNNFQRGQYSTVDCAVLCYKRRRIRGVFVQLSESTVSTFCGSLLCQYRRIATTLPHVILSVAKDLRCFSYRQIEFAQRQRHRRSYSSTASLLTFLRSFAALRMTWGRVVAVFEADCFKVAKEVGLRGWKGGRGRCILGAAARGGTLYGARGGCYDWPAMELNYGDECYRARD